MAGKSVTQSDAVLNVLRATNITAPSTVYVGLLSVAPANDGVGGTELTGAGGYARQSITFGAPGAGAGQARQIANTNTITFGAATGSDWAAAVAFGVYSALTAGTLLYWDALTASKTVAVGDSASFAAGALTVSED